MSLHVLPDPRLRRLAELVARYDGRTPRYTSYPTAAQFSPAVDETTYRGWLAALPADEAISLYVHIPFCARLCLYCGCNTRAVRRRGPISDYVTLLLREIAMLAEALPALPKLAPFIRNGLAALGDDGVLQVVGDGRLLIRSVAAAFDAYLDSDGKRHAKAI